MNENKLYNLSQKILFLTIEIEEKCPELYATLNETPILKTNHEVLKENDFMDYFNTLKIQLQVFNSTYCKKLP